MASGRVYSVPFSNITVAAVQDLWNLAATANMAFEILAMKLGQSSLTAVAGVQLTFERWTATVTNGSGGSSVTPTKANNGDAAATVTARCNDTTQATTSGSKFIIDSYPVNVLNGELNIPIPEIVDVIAPNQNLLIRLNTAPASSLWNGCLWFKELF